MKIIHSKYNYDPYDYWLVDLYTNHIDEINYIGHYSREVKKKTNKNKSYIYYILSLSDFYSDILNIRYGVKIYSRFNDLLKDLDLIEKYVIFI